MSARSLIRRALKPVLWLGYKWYLSKKRWHRHDGLDICVHPSVFHPGFLYSTKILLSFLSRQSVSGRRLLELGAGSGLIALWASRAGAQVSASDINPAALASIEESCRKNNLAIQLHLSDLFDEIPPQQFDFILINPPFYPGQPTNDREHAFFCGPEFEYFQKLFAQLPTYCQPSTKVYMILTDDCDVERILELAAQAALSVQLLQEQKQGGETHLIFGLSLS
ncbi:MAG: methyltransferase [Bacteroidota bacterium]